jgi:enoyl-[acyl-carrier protein] reductase II
MSSQRISTPLTELLGVDSPVMLAGMGGIAGKELVAAVANAGGFGTWGSATAVANMDPEELRAELRDIRERCNGRPFGVDLLVSGAEGGVMKQLVDMFADEGVKAFISGKGFPRKDVIDRFHARGVLVGSIAGRVKHAVAAVAGGVDFVIAQGHEAGGHTGNIASSVLLPQIVDAVNGRVPVVAAGGIFDGRGLASALAMGAAGVWVGTRFMLTPEAETHTAYKQRFLDASAEETVLTRAYTGAPLRVIKNPCVRH